MLEADKEVGNNSQLRMTRRSETDKNLVKDGNLDAIPSGKLYAELRRLSCSGPAE